MIVIGKQLSSKLSSVSFVCMCMIVGIHVHVSFERETALWYLMGMIRSLLDVAVPMFFVISGFLLAGHFSEHGWWLREVKKRVKSLLVPYVVWNLIYWGLSHFPILGTTDFRFGGDGGDILGLNPFSWSSLPYLWYVRCLMVYVFCAPLFLLCRRRRYGVLIMAFEWLLYVCVMMFRQGQWNEINWVKGACLFSLGIYMRWNGVWVMKCFSEIPVLLCWFIGIVISFVNITYVSAFGLVQSVGLCFLAVAVWRTIPSCQWPKWLTSSAFPIFLLHGAVLAFSEVFLFRITGDGVLSLCWWLLQVVCVVGICLALTFIMRRFAQSLSCVIFGGR